MNKFKNTEKEIVAASDAFFPFVDGIEKLIQSGVSAIIQPAGSIRDKEIIKFANEANKATYLVLLKLDLTLDPVISIKSAPTEGNKIKEDKIGKFI